MKGIVLFNGTKTSINNSFYNVTEVLKRYPKKRASEWWGSKRTQEYVRCLISSNVEFSTIKLFDSKAGRYSGKTVVHEKLIIDFARWLDPMFAIACDNFILNHIKGQENRLGEQQAQLDYFWDKEDLIDLYKYDF
jgi:hypothetical protein